MANTEYVMSYDDAYSAITHLHKKIEELSAERDKALETYPAYSEGFIFDEEKSVRWNREELQRRAKRREQVLKNYCEKERGLQREASNVIKEFIAQEFGLSPAVNDEIYAMAEENGHSAGFYEILSMANSYGEFAKRILRI